MCARQLGGIRFRLVSHGVSYRYFSATGASYAEFRSMFIRGSSTGEWSSYSPKVKPYVPYGHGFVTACTVTLHVQRLELLSVTYSTVRL